MIVLATIVACALVLAQGLAVFAFLRFVHSFGAYTESQSHLSTAMLALHESNLLLHQTNLRVLEELKAHQMRQEKIA